MNTILVIASVLMFILAFACLVSGVITLYRTSDFTNATSLSFWTFAVFNFCYMMSGGDTLLPDHVIKCFGVALISLLLHALVFVISGKVLNKRLPKIDKMPILFGTFIVVAALFGLTAFFYWVGFCLAPAI